MNIITALVQRVRDFLRERRIRQLKFLLSVYEDTGEATLYSRSHRLLVDELIARSPEQRQRMCTQNKKRKSPWGSI